MERLGYELPPGFRFHPTDQELITHYLKKKITSSLSPATSIIADIDLYKYNPWDLPDKAFFGEEEWFFFSPRDRKYPNGARPNRAAGAGYWKATGTDKPILASGSSQCLGVKKALVFYKGRPPKGIKTDWVMHEYRLLEATLAFPHPQHKKGSMRLDDWVLCRVRKRSSLPSQAEDEHVIPHLAPKLTNASAEKKGMKRERERERNNLFEGTDYQLLGYLLNSEDGGESDRTNDQGVGMFGAAGVQQPPLHEVLDTIKRKLSFGDLDELLMLPPNKRLNYGDVALDPFSPTGSSSVDETFMDFLI